VAYFYSASLARNSTGVDTIELAALTVAAAVYYAAPGGWQNWLDASLSWALLTPVGGI
jgi:hypothetical protein